jgi:hypothetical protein
MSNYSDEPPAQLDDLIDYSMFAPSDVKEARQQRDTRDRQTMSNDGIIGHTTTIWSLRLQHALHHCDRDIPGVLCDIIGSYMATYLTNPSTSTANSNSNSSMGALGQAIVLGGIIQLSISSRPSFETIWHEYDQNMYCWTPSSLPVRPTNWNGTNQVPEKVKNKEWSIFSNGIPNIPSTRNPICVGGGITPLADIIPTTFSMYAIFGDDRNMHRYDIITNKWCNNHSNIDQPLPQMKYGHAAGASVVLHDRYWIIAGMLGSLFIFNPALRVTVFYMMNPLIGGGDLVEEEVAGSSSCHVRANQMVEIYDSQSNTWSVLPSLPVPLAYMASVLDPIKGTYLSYLHPPATHFLILCFCVYVKKVTGI